MKFTVNIEKRYAYTIIALLIVIAGLLFVVAQVTNTPNPGHNADQIGPGFFSEGDGIPFFFPNSLITTGEYALNDGDPLDQVYLGFSLPTNEFLIRSDIGGNILSLDSVTGQLKLGGYSGPPYQLSIQTPDNAEDGIRLMKSTIDVNHILWSFSHRDNNQDLTIYGFDGDTFWNGIKFDWVNKKVQMDALEGIGNAYVCVNANGDLSRSASPCV